MSIIPIDHTTKRPATKLLPGGKWKPYQSSIADEARVRQWFASGVKSFAVVGGKVSGGLLVLDFDAPEFLERWAEAVGGLANGLPVQQTGGGGYQVLLRCADPGGNDKLAWKLDGKEETGRTIAIETRGEGGYAVVAPSLHPSGERYKWLGKLTAADAPTVMQAHAEKLLAAARALDEAPVTVQEQERIEAKARTAHRQHQASNNGHRSVIDAFNQAHSIDAILQRHGYTQGKGGRYVRPGGESESVSVKDGRSYHWSSNDPLNDGKAHDAFDVFTHYDYAGDVSAAVKAAADLLGMKKNRAELAGAGGSDGGDGEGEEKEERFSQAQLLVNLADDVELWHDADTAYATIQVEDHRENHPVNGKGFRSWLARQFWINIKKVPGAQALQDALGVLGGKAMYEG
ncbi:MAG: bifunctional DNA primase/polymerase, partial [Tepidisphaeraceae bacterium]